MISLLAFRNIVYRPWRSVLLFFGYGVGVSVMIVLLSVGEALLTQARDEKLVGGGSITVLPQGIDVEAMKTGGVGGLLGGMALLHCSLCRSEAMGVHLIHCWRRSENDEMGRECHDHASRGGRPDP